MSFDYSKLKGKIIEIYGTQREFARALGISERTLSLKLNGKIFWGQDEISKTLDLFGINKKEVCKYFFTNKVQKIEQNKQKGKE